jgi:hypothetical protein
MVELALVLPLLLILVLGIVDFGRAFNYWIDSTHLANVAARYATVNKNPGALEAQSLQRYIELQASSEELRDAPVDVCILFPAGRLVGDPVKVTVKSNFTWLGYLVDRAGLAPSSDIQGSATMRLEALPSNYTAGCS